MVLVWVCQGVCHGFALPLLWFAVVFVMELRRKVRGAWLNGMSLESALRSQRMDVAVFSHGRVLIRLGLAVVFACNCLGKFGVRGSSWRTRASEPLLVFELSLALEAPKTFGILRFFSHRAALPIADALANHESVHLEPNSGFRT